MSTFDYNSLLQRIKPLFPQYGREVEVVQYGTAEGSQPWKGSKSIILQQPLQVINVPPGSGLGLSIAQEQLFAQYESLYMAFPVGETDLREVDELRDLGEVYHVKSVARLKPGHVTMLWYFGVDR